MRLYQGNQSFFKMESLPFDILMNIFIKTTVADIQQICCTCTSLNICNNDYFWCLKRRNDFPDVEYDKPTNWTELRFYKFLKLETKFLPVEYEFAYENPMGGIFKPTFRMTIGHIRVTKNRKVSETINEILDFVAIKTPKVMLKINVREIIINNTRRRFIRSLNWDDVLQSDITFNRDVYRFVVTD